jgi:hypothetical protein
LTLFAYSAGAGSDVGPVDLVRKRRQEKIEDGGNREREYSVS